VVQGNLTDKLAELLWVVPDIKRGQPKEIRNRNLLGFLDALCNSTIKFVRGTGFPAFFSLSHCAFDAVSVHVGGCSTYWAQLLSCPAHVTCFRDDLLHKRLIIGIYNVRFRANRFEHAHPESPIPSLR
jgi:hypothetical protein